MNKPTVVLTNLAVLYGLFSLSPSTFPLSVTLEAQCSNVPGSLPYSGWVKNSHPAVNTSGIPSDVSAIDANGNVVTVHPKALVEQAISEFNTWLSNNTNSGVVFSATSSGGAVQMIDSAATSGGINRPAATTPSTSNNHVDGATIRIDLSGANAAAPEYTQPSGRSGTVPWYDPIGTDPATGNKWSGMTDPAGDYSSAIKQTTKHELMHTMGLADQTNAAGNSIMNGAYVPNDRASQGSRGQPSDPTACDKEGLKNIYPPTPEEDPEWWYGYCGVSEQDVYACEHQVDQYWYDFEGGCNCTPGASPVIVDLDGGGFRLTGVDAGVAFDLFGRGSPVYTAWTPAGAREAFLVLDRSGNGTIDSGRELFGNVTEQSVPGPGEVKNGFRALAEFDQPSQGGNGDGEITERDAVFSQLRLWVDFNHDGVSQPTELLTLASEHVVRIELRTRETRRIDRYGNQMRFVSDVFLSDPVRVRFSVDVFFKWHY